MLQSTDRGVLVFDRFTLDFRAELGRRSPEPVTVTEFVVAPPGFTEAPAQSIVAFLRSAFADQMKPDLLVTVGGAASTFARSHRQELFPETPILYASTDTRFLAAAPLGAGEAAVTTTNDFVMLLDDILRVLPATEHIFVVTGSGPTGVTWRRELASDFQRYAQRLDFIWSDTLTYRQTLDRAANLPANSAVMLISSGTFAEGMWFDSERTIRELSTTANAPLFGAHGVWLGLGEVGGRLLFNDHVGALAADSAVRILAGESPSAIRVPAVEQGPAAFDARELKRWNIPLSRLPAGSEVRFGEPTLWERYKGVVIAGASIVLAQAALIAALLMHRRKRRRAEASLREHVSSLDAARASLSHLSGRLLQAQEEERTRLARELHDDIAQRLSFASIDLTRLRDLLPPTATSAREYAESVHDSVQALGQDVQSISHGLHSSKLEYLGLAKASESFCKEISSRHTVDVTFAGDNVPKELPPVLAISVFRVLQEGVSNAAKHSGAKHCRVTLNATVDALHLEIVDDGRGFDLRAASAGHGLGLVSMQERLKLLYGIVTIESAIGAGTSIHARVPLEQAAASPQAPPRARAAS